MGLLAANALSGTGSLRQQALQFSQRVTVDGGRRCGSNATAGYWIEHPLRHFQQTRRLERFQRAAQNRLCILPLDRPENPHRAPAPRVLAVKNFL